MKDGLKDALTVVQSRMLFVRDKVSPLDWKDIPEVAFAMSELHLVALALEALIAKRKA